MKRLPQTEQGNLLIITLVTIATVAGFLALAIDLTTGVGRNVQRSMLLRQATNIGDAATEMAFADWRAICIKNTSSPAPAGQYFDTNVELPSPSPGNFPGVTQYRLTNFGVVPLDANWKPLGTVSTGDRVALSSNNTVVPPKVMGPNPQNYSYYYMATADVIIPTMTAGSNWMTQNFNGGNVVARVRRVLEKYNHNKTDKAIDYKDDLEIHPGPNFVVNGDVHTNGNLYTGHDTLTLSGSTTYAGNWEIGFMPGDGAHNGEKATSPGWGSGLPPSQAQAVTPFGVDTPDYHSLIDNVGSTDPLYKFSFSNQAIYTVKITIDGSNNIRIYNSSGTDITSKANQSDSGTDSNRSNVQIATVFMNALSTNETIRDNRQGATTGNSTIRVASLDVGAINNAIESGKFSKVDFKKPVVYITDTSATNPAVDASKQRGIRLRNGAILPPQGLTVASSNPIYIQGDYNTGSYGSTQPQSNTSPDSTNAPTGNPARPTVANYERAPSAVIADAVTVLSNNWADSKSANSSASNTTVNTAIIAGIVPTENGNYSGGAENFPRFLENWGGKTLTYYGSMIQMYVSKQAIGRWGAANVYGAPNRAWYFDRNFLSNPPIGVPYDVDYRRSRWYME